MRCIHHMWCNFYYRKNPIYQVVFILLVRKAICPTVPERSTIRCTALLPSRQFEHGGAPCRGRCGGRQHWNRADCVRFSQRRCEETSVRDSFPHRRAAGLPAQRMVGNLLQKSKRADRCWCASVFRASVSWLGHYHELTLVVGWMVFCLIDCSS